MNRVQNTAASEAKNHWSSAQWSSSYEALSVERDQFKSEVQELRSQLEWFRQQIFGSHSERQIISPDQLALFLGVPPQEGQQQEPPGTTVAAHKRRKKRTGKESNDTGLRFDPEVPQKIIDLVCPELDGPDADQYEVVGYKESYRLASTPGTSVVLCYRRPVVKHKPTEVLSQPPAPLGPLGHAQVDVSFLAGMLVDKFLYHTPLYRQHQKLQDQGVTLSSGTLTNWVQRSISLLEPVAEAVHEIIVSGSHIKIDETPIKAGRSKKANPKVTGSKGRMKQGWLWPMLGEHGDIAFHYSPSRALQVLAQTLDGKFSGVLQSDGYEVYARYAALHENIIHALCWSHTRRMFLKAEQSDPLAVKQILTMIALLYRIERQLRERSANAEEIVRIRQARSERCVKRIFRWVKEQRQKPELLPKSPLAKALNYTASREAGLRVFLSDSWVALDTNDLERALRIIPMGKKNWMFCTTEMGAEHVAIIQTLLASCRAHGVNPYDYLVDVLQRIDIHPAKQVQLLTPRLWQTHFANDPMRSPLYDSG